MDNSIFTKYLNNQITYGEFEEETVKFNEKEENYENLGLSESEYLLYKRLGKQAIDNIVEARKLKVEIIEKWKNFFRDEIAERHRKNTLKLVHLKEFNLNPFLDNYKANFLLGDSSPKSKAAAMIYARALGTSINTTFGTNLQKFCSHILSGYASTTKGIDIEYEDFLDGRKKYCQIKAGPNTINRDDVKTIVDHFSGVKNLARTNNLNIGINDLVVGVFYGEEKDLSNHYKSIQKEYSVYIGKEFWYRLTGDSNFYSELTKAIDEVASEYDGRELLKIVIEELALEIERAEN
jgi:hypothetical protein